MIELYQIKKIILENNTSSKLCWGSTYNLKYCKKYLFIIMTKVNKSNIMNTYTIIVNNHSKQSIAKFTKLHFD